MLEYQPSLLDKNIADAENRLLYNEMASNCFERWIEIEGLFLRLTTQNFRQNQNWKIRNAVEELACRFHACPIFNFPSNIVIL